jgi:hypothetical protein
MKNKLLLAALAVFLVGGFTACKDDILDVRNVADKANAVAGVVATPTTDKTNVILTWDAVDNVSWYSVYVKMVDTKTAERVSGGNPTNSVVYKVDGTTSSNTNPDKWTYLVPVTGAVSGKNYVFGVQTQGYSNFTDNSDIVWSNPITAP